MFTTNYRQFETLQDSQLRVLKCLFKHVCILAGAFLALKQKWLKTSNHNKYVICHVRIKSEGGRGAGGLEHLEKSQVAIGVLRDTGTDPS